jgi:iron complex transport system ATP-binding protein
MSAIEMKRVCFSYSNGLVLRDVELCVQKGEMVGLIGPNGAGKTTLIRIISGILNARQGEVKLDGLDVGRLKRNALAREVAVVPQQFNIPFAYKVEEVVMLGRTPFMKPFRDSSERDRDVIMQTVYRVGIRQLVGRYFGELSGGERQKVVLAMALAQETGLLLLDEPTAHLDISHQVEMLELLAGMNAERGLTIISAMHDLNLASAYFGRLVLMKEGAIVADGPPERVLTSSTIAAAYSVPVHIQPHPFTGVPQVVVLPPTATAERLRHHSVV